MLVNGWRYYNHAAVPTTPPHIEPDLTPIKNGAVWRNLGRAPLLARWTSDWDCGYETNWWYLIKDTPFDIAKLKSKRRYEINKGRKHFEAKRIDPAKFKQEIYETTIKAFESYPSKYRPSIEETKFKNGIDKWNELTVIGAIERESGKLEGYAYLKDEKMHSDLVVLRVNPDMEKYSINAALVDGIMEEYKDKLNGDYYISDGARTVLHETSFQDYLEKYFDFRKAYCNLHIKYRPIIGISVKMLYPFREIINGNTRIGSQIIAVLKLEEFRQKQ